MRAVLCGYYGKGNAGDEALLATLLQMLPELVQPVVLSGNPRETRSCYEVEAYDRFSAWSVWSALRSADVFVLGGGSLLQDSTSLFSLVYYVGLTALAQAMGLKTIAWGQGIGPLNRPLSQWLAAQVLQHCTAISVRDGASARWLSQRQMNCMVAPDPVWGLAPLEVADPITLPHPRIALCLRPHPLLTDDRLALLIEALGQVQQSLNAGIVAIPFHHHDDRELAISVLDALPGATQLLDLQHPQQLKGVFQFIDLTLSMRLHGLIMAAAAGSRCYGLSYDPKVSRLMEELCLPGWALADLPVNAAQIAQQLKYELEYGSPLSADQILSLRDRSLMHQDLFNTVLLGNP
ncbi:MAG: polysaccharide pyruvyl transferase CsaB [Prochlorotrichaceae cyanobacterium]